MKDTTAASFLPPHIKLNAKRLIVLILYVGSLMILTNQNLVAECGINRYDGSRGYTESVWIFRQGNTVLDSELKVPAFRPLQAGQTYRLSTTLTYDGTVDDVPGGFFFVDHMYCRAMLDGKVLFSYMPWDVKKPDRSRSPGNIYASFQLPADCQGRELVIELVPALDASMDYQIPEPTFGDYATTAAYAFRQDLPHNLMVVLCASIGVLSVLLSTVVLPDNQYREGIYMGIFATLFSCYGLTESDFDFYVISNPYYTYLLDYVSFSLLPLFLMAFIRERLGKKQRRITLWMLLAGAGMVVTEFVLHFTGVMDAREFLPILHIVYGSMYLAVFCMLLTMKKDVRKKHLILQLIPILCGMVLDVSVYYMHWQLGTSDSTFMTIGVVIFLVSELLHVWKYTMEVYTESVWSQAYREMAFVDALTGIPNRRAFETEKSSVEANEKLVRSMIAVSADVNDLKIANDTLGHSVGDFLIRSAAEVLSDLAQSYGHAYRMGGDEFIVLLYNMSEREFQIRLDVMRKKIAQINENAPIPLSIAIGYEFCNNRDFETVVKTADRRMYENKARYKAEIAGK